MSDFDFSGASRVETKIIEFPVFAATQQGAIGMINLRTDRGEYGKEKLISTEQAFIDSYGKRNADISVNDTMYARILLKMGIRLRVNRIVHYTDIDDLNTVDGAKATFTLTDVADVVVWDAPFIGVGYNGIVITTTAAASGTANKLDVTIALPDSGTPISLKNLSDVPTTAEIELFNQQSEFVKLTSFTTKIPIGVSTLAGGTQNMANIVTADYQGSVTVKNGLKVLDDVSDSFRILNIRPVPAINKVIDDYVAGRSVRTTALFTAPLGLSGSGYLDYVKGEGAYVATAYVADNELLSYNIGPTNIADIDNPDVNIDVPGALVEFAMTLINDATGDIGSSPAELPQGRVTYPNNGVTFDLAAGNNRKNFWDELESYGVNIVTNKAQQGTSETFAALDGNKTCKLDQTSLLSRKNIVDTVNWTSRNSQLFFEGRKNKRISPRWLKENQILYTQSIIQTLIDNEAIDAPDTTWRYLGDQDIRSLSQAEINDPDELQIGNFQMYFVFTPFGVASQIRVGIVPTTSSSFDIIINELNS